MEFPDRERSFFQFWIPCTRIPCHLDRWLPSQKGLFPDLPQQQSVIRFLTSYVNPSAEMMGIPPRTQRGPPPPPGSWTTPMDFSKTGSMGVLVFLSHTTRRPEWQFAAISMASLRASGSDDRPTRSQIPFPRMQKRAWEQNPGASESAMSGPSTHSARCKYGTLLAVSVPSKWIIRCVPSQNGLLREPPHRHREYVSATGYCLPSSHLTGFPSRSQTRICTERGIQPVTI
jgi:hypothetical protein